MCAMLGGSVRREPGLRVEPGEPVGVAREDARKDFDRDVASSFVSRARNTSPMPPAPIWEGSFVDAEARAGGEEPKRSVA